MSESLDREGLKMLLLGILHGNENDIHFVLSEFDRIRKVGNWTSEKPKKAGFYWYQNGRVGIRASVLEVTDPKKAGMLDNGEWAGPIEFPGIKGT